MTAKPENRPWLPTVLSLAIVLAGVSLSAPAARADGAGLDGWGVMAEEEMAAQSGGAETFVFDSNNVTQSNDSDVSGTNHHNQVLNEGLKWSGDVGTTIVRDNRGVTNVMQNTGDLVNLNNNVTVNVNLR